MIGNGWISPVEQSLAILPYAYENLLVAPDTAQAVPLETQQEICQQKLRTGGADHVETGQCEHILREIFRVTRDPLAPNASQCINMYDLRLRDSYPDCGANFPPSLDATTAYLRRPDVLGALHVDADRTEPWAQCTDAVGRTFKANHSRPSVELLPALLETMPVVLYSGEQDLICNHRGTEQLIRNLQWGGARGFEVEAGGAEAPIARWEVDGELAGTYREARNLSFVLFHNASHMVPYDQPSRARDMLHRLMNIEAGEGQSRLVIPDQSPKSAYGDGDKADGSRASLADVLGDFEDFQDTVSTEIGGFQSSAMIWQAGQEASKIIFLLCIVAVSIYMLRTWQSYKLRMRQQNTPNSASPRPAERALEAGYRNTSMSTDSDSPMAHKMEG